MELEDGELPVASVANNGPSSAAADDQLRAQLHETTQDLRHQGQLNLARLVHALAELDLRDARWVLDDDVRAGDGEFSGDHALFDAFRHSVHLHLFNLSHAGYEDHDVSAVLAQLVLSVAQQAAEGLLQLDDDDDTTQSYGSNGGGASAAAVRRLEKQTFRAGVNERLAEGGGCGVTECSVCFEEFVDGGQVTVMPCPSHGHRFHPNCIAKWLRISNTCPLCRHVLPA